MRITLYELFGLCDIEDIDIADNTYDFVVCFGCRLKKGQCKDSYDFLMRRFATMIECDKLDIGSPALAHCYIEDFIKKNIKVFNDFMEEYHYDDYKPSSYEEIDDELFYDLYFNMFQNLVVGNYSYEAYQYLLDMFGGK